MSDEPVIEMPDGSPGAVDDAGASLNRVAGGFETAGQVVARATAQTGAWQGQAPVSFHGRAAGYSQALLAVNQALVQARGAVRRYHAQLEHARDRIRALRQREQDAVERLRGARRKLADAKRRLQDAEQRAGAASLSIGSMTGAPDPIGLAEQAAAQRDARDAQDDIDAAGRLIDRVQEEIRELRREAHRRHQDLIEDERGAAAQVRDAAAQLPDIQMPGGASSPSAYAGTAFAGATSAFGAGRNWKGAMERARDEEAKLYTADEFGGGQALDQINDGVRKGTIPPRPPNFDEMSIAQKGRYLYQRTGLHPHEDSPGEAAGKIFTFLSLANPATGAGRLGMSTVARHILPDAVRKASQAFRGKAARGTARLTEHLLARRADDVFPGQTPQKPPGTDTHHVVPKGEYVNRSQDAREALHQAQGKLDDLGIGADDAANGVFLDRDLHRVLDEDASDVSYAPDEPGKIMWIDRWAVHPELLAQETIFNLARDPAPERYVTDVVRDRIEQAGLTGFWWRSRLYPPTEPPPVPDLDPDPGSRIYTRLVPDPDELGDPEEIVTHRIIPAFEADNTDLHHAQAQANQLGIGPDDGVNGCFLTRRAHTEAYTEAYFKELHQRLAQARSTKEAQTALTTIGDQLEAGDFPT